MACCWNNWLVICEIKTDNLVFSGALENLPKETTAITSTPAHFRGSTVIWKVILAFLTRDFKKQSHLQWYTSQLTKLVITINKSAYKANVKMCCQECNKLRIIKQNVPLLSSYWICLYSINPTNREDELGSSSSPRNCSCMKPEHQQFNRGFHALLCNENQPMETVASLISWLFFFETMLYEGSFK